MVSEKCHVLRGTSVAYLIAKLPLVLVLGYFFDPGINYNRFLKIYRWRFYCCWRKGRSVGDFWFYWVMVRKYYL